MKLGDMQRSKSKKPVYSARLADEDGNHHYELSISGPQRHIERVFEKSDFEIEIAPSVNEAQFAERSRRFWDSHVERKPRPAPPIADVTALLSSSKSKPPGLTKDPVVFYVRRTEGQGTFYGMWLPFVVLPPGVPFIIYFHSVWATASSVLPYAGNPNLFLNVGLPPPAPPVSASILPGLSIDSVSWATTPFPWSQGPAWHRIVVAGTAVVVTDFLVFGHSVRLF